MQGGDDMIFWSFGEGAMRAICYTVIGNYIITYTNELLCMLIITPPAPTLHYRAVGAHTTTG